MTQEVPLAPRRTRSAWTTIGAVLVALVSACYLFNPGFGVVELLPDNLPVVGNLDEVAFTWALGASLAALGVEAPLLKRRRL